MTDRHLMVIGYLQSIIEGLQAGEIDEFKADMRFGAVKIEAGALSAEEELRFDGSFGVTIFGVRRPEREKFNQLKADCPHLAVDRGIWRVADKRGTAFKVFIQGKPMGTCDLITLEAEL